MKRKATVVRAIGGVDTVIQDVVPAVKTTAICPACKVPFRENAATVLIELVRQFSLADGKPRSMERAVRIHVCEQCAQPVVAQKKEAMEKFLSLIAEMIADDLMKEMDEENLKRQATASSGSPTRPGKSTSRRRRPVRS